MIGNIKPKLCDLPKNVKEEYLNIYCSLCAVLRKKYGFFSSFIINNEITLILLSLRNYFKPEIKKTNCPAYLYLTKKTVFKDKIINQGIKWSLLLAWFASFDSYNDNPGFLTKLKYKYFNKQLLRLKKYLNDKEIKLLDSYNNTIKNDNDFENTVKTSAKLACFIFNEISSYSNIKKPEKEILAGIFYIIGELITIADSLLDIPVDLQKNNYNPMISDNNFNIYNSYLKYEDILNKKIDIIKNQFKTLKEKNISNTIFTTVMENSLNNLCSRITVIRHKLQYLSINPDGSIGKKEIKILFPQKKYVFLKTDCCQQCCNDCCNNCCEQCCSNCRC